MSSHMHRWQHMWWPGKGEQLTTQPGGNEIN